MKSVDCGSTASSFDRAATGARPAPLIDPFGRAITYLRVSVTDRCDFRCVYCMAEDMTFLPKADLLTLEELDRLCRAFIAKGVRKLRLTGGEPLVRREHHDAGRARSSRHLRAGALDELTLTTNGTQLAEIRRTSSPPAASSASTSRSTRSTPTSSAPSPAGASSTR